MLYVEFSTYATCLLRLFVVICLIYFPEWRVAVEPWYYCTLHAHVQYLTCCALYYSSLHAHALLCIALCSSLVCALVMPKITGI